MPPLRPLYAAASIAAIAFMAIGYFPASSRAADSAPSNKLVITKALYGDLSEDNALDVTKKVAALVADNSLSVMASNALGNPPGAGPKQLKVSYIIDGIYRSKTVNDGETLDISTRLFIRKAIYGALPNGATVDVTDQIAGLVRKNHLSVQATNEAFGGDPAEGIVKSLRVDYTLDGVDGSTTVRENQTVTVPAK